jgi:hypothetical protein
MEERAEGGAEERTEGGAEGRAEGPRVGSIVEQRKPVTDKMEPH